jgi:hypothetical protein
MDNAVDVLVAGFAMMTKWFSSTRAGALVAPVQLFAQNQSGPRVCQLVTLNNRSEARGLEPALDLSSV